MRLLYVSQVLWCFDLTCDEYDVCPPCHVIWPPAELYDRDFIMLTFFAEDNNLEEARAFLRLFPVETRTMNVLLPESDGLVLY